MNVGKAWLQHFADVSANGRTMLTMKTNARPPRIDYLGLSIVTNVDGERNGNDKRSENICIVVDVHGAAKFTLPENKPTVT